MRKLILCLAFVVTWKAVSKNEWHCDVFTKDQYTEEYIECEKEKEHKREFFTMQEASIFVSKCPVGVCSDWKIEEKK